MQTGRRPLALRLVTFAIFTLLVAVLAYGTGELVHAQLLSRGESFFPGYAELRVDLPKPTCDPASFVVPEADPNAPPKAEEDLMDDLDSGGGAAAPEAIKAAKEKCEREHADYASHAARLTPGLLRYRGVEQTVASAVELGVSHVKHLLVILLMLAAAAATWTRSHLSIRAPGSIVDERASQVAQLLANLVFVFSAFALWKIDANSASAASGAALHVLWIVGFLAMAAMNVAHLVRPAAGLTPGGRWSTAGSAVPLYAVMALVAGGYFIVKESYPAGLAVQLELLTEHSLLYIQVGLYVWIGMLLKRSTLVPKMFDVLRPFSLPPPVLAFVVVAAAAGPTAYSGASGIFVMAAGALIYEELRRSGASRQLAFAATSMSGSLGVVVRPCLLVVIVASLNKQVTTDELYGWGLKVYALTATLFLVAALLFGSSKEKVKFSIPRGAFGQAASKLLTMWPDALVAVVVLGFYAVVLATGVNEHSAPNLLPVLMLALLALDKWRERTSAAPGNAGFFATANDATDETSHHIGALLLLMGASVGVGGVISRSGVMGLVPESLGSPVAAMGFLLLLLIVVGMTMDPYGAVILVSATFGEVAYKNGIHPAHFWMVVLAAFELGYLMPPIALNRLLTRKVVGEDEWQKSREEGTTLVSRNLATVLPVTVLAVTLLLVAFVPFGFY